MFCKKEVAILRLLLFYCSIIILLIFKSSFNLVLNYNKETALVMVLFL